MSHTLKNNTQNNKKILIKLGLISVTDSIKIINLLYFKCKKYGRVNEIITKTKKMCKKHKEYELIYTCENCGQRYCQKCKQYSRLYKNRFSNHYLKLKFSSFRDHVKSLNLCPKCINLIDNLYNKDRYDPKAKVSHGWRDLLIIFNGVFLVLWVPITIFLFFNYVEIGLNIENAQLILFAPIITTILFNIFCGIIPFLIKKSRKKTKLSNLSRFFEDFGNFCPICGELIKIDERYCEDCKKL